MASSVQTDGDDEPLKEILWPPNLEDISALRRLAVIKESWTAVADAIRIHDEAGEERLRYTYLDYENDSR